MHSHILQPFIEITNEEQDKIFVQRFRFGRKSVLKISVIKVYESNILVRVHGCDDLITVLISERYTALQNAHNDCFMDLNKKYELSGLSCLILKIQDS